MRLYTLSASLVLLAVATTPNVDKAADCTNIAGRRTAAVAKVTEALQSYQKCVGSGDNSKDCGDEMQALDDAHDDFADAIADAKSCQ